MDKKALEELRNKYIQNPPEDVYKRQLPPLSPTEISESMVMLTLVILLRLSAARAVPVASAASNAAPIMPASPFFHNFILVPPFTVLLIVVRAAHEL